MKGVTNYLKNITKSVAYATADVVKQDLMPNVDSFASSNKEFMVNTYSAVRNPKASAKKTINAFKESKYYTAIDYGARNLFEDLRTGNLYNKERYERDESKFSAWGDFDDLSEFDIDDDTDNNSSNTITDGDKLVVESIENTSRTSASITAKAISSATQYSVNNSRLNIGILFEQNERLFAGLHKDISTSNALLDSMHKIVGSTLPNIDKNMADYFSKNIDLNKERNAMLKEMLEMQRNLYKSASDREREAASKKSSKVTWSDISDSNGNLDLGAYVESLKNGVKEWTDLFTSATDMMGDLRASFISPGEHIVKGIVRKAIPKMVKDASKELDKTINKSFATAMARLSNKKASGDIMSPIGLISQFLGLDTSITKVNSGKYYKGAVPFDGITRKSIIDVIPTYLRRIDAGINGREELIYNYDTGKWVTHAIVKKDFNDIKKRTIDSYTSDLMKNMGGGINAIKNGMRSMNEQDEFDRAIEEFKLYLFDHLGDINENMTAKQNGVSQKEYPYFYKYYKDIMTVYKNIGRDRKTGMQKYISNKMMSDKMFEAREALDRQYREIQASGHDLRVTQFAEGLDHNTHGTISNGKFVAHNLLSTKDELGNTIYNYLQKITAELQLIRSSNGVYRSHNKKRTRITGSLSDADIKRMLMNASYEEEIRNQELEDEEYYNDAVEKNNNFVSNNIITGKAVDRRLSKIRSIDYYKQIADMSSVSDENNPNRMDMFMEQEFIKQAREKYPDDERKQKEWIDHLYNQYIENKNKAFEKYDGFKTKYTGIAKVIDKLNGAKNTMKNIANAPAQMFSNLLYSADRAIYNMFFKSEVEDDDHNKYKSYLDFLVGKAVDTFDKSVNKLEEKLNPIKDRILKFLGIDDKFKSDFKDTMKSAGSSAWKYFKQSNIDVYNDARRGINKMKFRGKTKDEQDLLIREAALNALYANNKRGDRRATQNIPDSVYLKDPAKMKKVLQEAGVFKNISKDKLDRYYDENTELGRANIIKAYDRYMQRTHAIGTFGAPFMGKSMLSKGELLFNDSGVSVVNKTGAYSVDKPTHILNSYDSYNVLNKMGLGSKGNKPIGSKQSTIMKDLAKENSIKNKIFNHAEGTTSNDTADKIKDIINKLKNKYKDLDIDFDQMKEDVSASKGKIAAGGVIGGVASLLLNIVGGPILGALVGSAASFISSNDELKDKLFGEKDTNGKRNGGKLLNDKIMAAVNKYLPDMGKYGMVGIIPGLLTPLGPIGGLLAGGAIGFLKNNESFMDKYFGEKDENGERQGGKLNISKDSRDIIRKFLPAGTKGAAVGAIASVLVGGPFGLLGNAALGSAVGMVSVTDEFKDGILGKSINGVRSGGLLDKVNKLLDPVVNPFIEIRDRMINILDKNIADPLSRFINPFIHQVPIILGAIPKMINNAVADKISKVKTDNGLIGKTVRGAGKLATGAANAVTTPFRLLGFAGDKLRMHQIRKGTADDMTAAERIEFARSQLKLSDNADRNQAILDKFNQDNAFDMALADIGKDGGMSIEDAEVLRDNMTSVTDSVGSLRRQKQKAAKEITGYLSNVQLKNGGKLDAKKLNKALRDGKINDFERSLRKSMTEQEYNDFKQSTGDAFKVFNEASRRERIAGSMSKADKETAFRKSADALKEFGIDVKSPDDLLKYSKLIDTEILNAKAHDRKEQNLLNKQPENVDRIRTAVENIADMIAGLTGFDNGRRNSSISRYAERKATESDNIINDTIKNAESKSYNLYEAQADKVADTFGEVPDMLTNNKTANKLSNYIKDGYISINIVDKINPKYNNIKLLVKIKDLKYNMDDETTLYFNNELSRVRCKNIYDVLKQKNVRKFLKGRDLSIDDLNTLSNIVGHDVKQFDKKCGALLANGKSSKNMSIADIVKMQFNDAHSNTVENNGIGTFLLGAVSKGLVGGAKAIGSGISSLFKGKDDSITNDKKKAGLLSSIFGNNSVNNTNKPSEGNLNSDETDDPNDGKDIAPLDRGFGKYVKKSDGSVEWDQSDPATKMLLNIRQKREALQEKYQAAQLKTSEMLEKVFSNDEDKSQKKLKWWQLLLAGIVAAPFVKKFINNMVKPIWEQAISPWLKDTALPWLEDKFTKTKDWFFDEALPKLQDNAGQLLATFAESLPEIICNGIKGTFRVGSSFAGSLFGKKSNVGGKSTLNTEDKNGSELSNITDKDGNKLTYGQIQSGEYNDNMYNAQGAKATVDEDGNIIFEDQSDGNAAYISRMGNAMGRSFIKGNTGFALTTTSKLANKLLSNKNILSKGAGLGLKAVTAPLEFAANPMKAISKGADVLSTGAGKVGEKALKIIDGCKSLLNKLFGDSKVLKKLAQVADVLGIKNIDEWIINIHSKLDDLFSKTIKESAEKVGKSQLGHAVSKVTAFLGPIMAVADFLTGCDKAESILGVSDTGIVEELVAGFTNAVCNFTIILSIIPGVNSIASSIMNLFTDSNEFEQRQKEADEEVEKYNEENGTTYSKEEYLERNKSFTGKVWGKVKDTFSSIFGGNKDTEESTTDISSVENNALGTVQLDPISKINPFANLNNTITDIINRLTTGENNTDDIIEQAKTGKISIFSKEYWENTISEKQGLAGTIETAYNSLTKIIQLPLIITSKIFGGTSRLAETLSRLSGVSLNTQQSNNAQQTNQSSPSSSSEGDGIFTKIWKGIKSIFGKGSGQNKYGRGYAKQIDPAIANIRFNAPGDTEYQTIGDSACGPAAAVSAIQSAFGRGKNDVVDASKYAIDHGYKEKNGGTKPAFFKDYFDKYGLGSEMTSDKVTLANRISKGQPTVLMGRGGIYGSGTHYLAATGTDGYGNVYVNDPSSPRGIQSYKMNTILKNSKFGISTKDKYGRGKIIYTNKFGRGKVETDSEGRLKGKTINIPNGLGKIHTYMAWQMITAPSSAQYKLREKAGQKFNSEGFGVINGRYVIACTTTFGNIGDYIDFYKEDGNIIQAVIGDIKNQNDSGCNKWGHLNGTCIVEFVVDKNSWYNTNHDNPGTKSCHPEWGNKAITKAVNGGSYFDDPTIAGNGATASATNTTTTGTETKKTGLIGLLSNSLAGKALSAFTGLFTSTQASASTTNETSANNDDSKSTSDYTPNESISPLQQKVVNAAKSIQSKKGYCARWAHDVYEEAGQSPRAVGNAIDMVRFKVSDSKNPPVGAAIYAKHQWGMTDSNPGYGHEGIYMGNNIIYSPEGGKPKERSIEDWSQSSHYGWNGWGFDGWTELQQASGKGKYGRGKSDAGSTANGNDVVAASRFAINGGYKEKDGGTRPEFFRDYFNKNGLDSSMSYNKETILSNIAKGQPTVLMGQDRNGASNNTPYGPYPHYVTVTGLDSKGNAIVQDPESKYDNLKYNIKTLLNKSSFGVSARSKYGRGIFGRGDIASDVWGFLKNKGCTDQAAAGIMGNLKQESGMNPSVIQGGGRGPAAGICQWENYNTKSGRWKSMADYAASKGKDWTDLQSQLEYLWKELEGADSTTKYILDKNYGGLNGLMSCNDINRACDIFEKAFERAGIPNMSNRYKYAKEYYDKFKGTMGTSNSSSSSAAGIASTMEEATNNLISNLSNSKAGKALSAFNELITGTESTSSTTTDSSTTTGTITNNGVAATDAAEKATRQMEAWAADDSHGYSQTNDRLGNPDLDCSGAVTNAWEKAGIPVRTNGANVCSNMIKPFTKLGFKDVSSSINKSNGSGLKRGDVLLNPNHHTAMWTGSGIVQASISETGGITGKPGDQTGKEVWVTDGYHNYYNGGWTNILRYGAGKFGRNTEKLIDKKEMSYQPMDAYQSYLNSFDKKLMNKTTPKQGTLMGRGSSNSLLSSITNKAKDITSNLSSITASNNNAVMQTNNTIDYSQLLNVIIKALATIADNTDRLNTIVTLLNDRLGTDISASEVSTASMNSNKESIKSKLKKALLNQQKDIMFDSSNDNSSMNVIIKAMNAIASE